MKRKFEINVTDDTIEKYMQNHKVIKVNSADELLSKYNITLSQYRKMKSDELPLNILVKHL